MTTVVCISDTHGHVPRAVPDGDVLVHAGDGIGDSYGVPGAGLRALRKWMGELPHAHKVYVPGNHDAVFSDEPAWARKFMAEAGVTVLVDQEVSLGGLRVWGSPWCPEFGNWWFMKPAEFRARAFAMIPDGLDMLITHTPPRGRLDYRHKFKHPESLGCHELAARLVTMDKAPRLHVFGHIHGGYGMRDYRSDGEVTVLVNAAHCDEAYRPVNPPIVVEL